MWNRVIFLLVMCAAVGGYYLWQTPQMLDQIKGKLTTVVTDSPPPSLYKWADKNGQVTYGAKPPKGVRAERMDESNTSISVVPATKVPVFPVLDEASSDPRSIGQRAIDRAIEQSTQ